MLWKKHLKPDVVVVMVVLVVVIVNVYLPVPSARRDLPKRRVGGAGGGRSASSGKAFPVPRRQAEGSETCLTEGTAS